ncbi:MAG: hypothetical protein ABIN36_14720, partial [Ferruginibacter sp.]
TGAAFRRLKKYAAHFFNCDYVATRRKDAPYAGTDRIRTLLHSKLKADFSLRLFYLILCLIFV